MNKLQRSLAYSVGGSVVLGFLVTQIDPAFREPAQWAGAVLGFVFGIWAQNR